ncbi:hypothetical protein [Streptomyces atroolivaceus]|uniref:hypothetical protein n=1 Tax=Streptomyces atroolivaceus TaxID=66869 RepID=UPI0036779B49
MESISPRNLTAQLAYRARGNPPVTTPASSVGNYYPGLELDLRNLWRRVFAGIQLHEAVALVLAADDDAPEEVRALVGEILLSVDGHPVWVEMTGPRTPGGADESLGNWSLEWSNALADVVQKAGQEVRCTFTKGEDGQQDVSLTVRKVFEESGHDGGDDTRTAVLSRELAQPGELTQSLCSPWQNDFIGCGCYYWAASRPDYVNVEADEGDGSRGHNWLQRDRTATTPKFYTLRQADLLQHAHIIAGWEDKLRFVLEGKDVDDHDGD